MEPKEISVLVEKLKNNSITTLELARLKKLMASSSTVKEMLSSMQQDYADLATRIDKLEQWNGQEHLKEKVLLSIQGEIDMHPAIHEPFDPQQNTSKTFGLRKLAWIAAAAAILLTGFLFLYTPQKPQTKISWETIRTEHGERKKFMLSDGTEVMLNGNSSFSYSKTQLGELRLVKLRGEAFFDVTKDQHKPFVILTRDFVTKVLGTSFNIDSDIERSVEVNTGVVEIGENRADQLNLFKQENLDSITNYVTNSTKQKFLLHKGEKATLSSSGWQVRTFKDKNWHNNELIHMNEPLEQVLRKAYRYFGDSVAVSEKLAKTKISISFRNKNIEQVLKTLAELSDGNLIKRNDHEWEIM